MRELVFKALTSAENKKRDFCIHETITKNGVLAETKRRCFYFILGKTHIDDYNDLKKLAEVKFANLPYKKRHYYILKTHDDKHGEDKLVCKVAGSFYAVCGNEIYCIAFLHALKITFTVLALDKEKGQDAAN